MIELASRGHIDIPLSDKLRLWVLTGVLKYDYEMIELLAIAGEYKRKGTCPYDFQEYLSNCEAR